MLTAILQSLIEKPQLSHVEAETAMSLILDDADPHQTAAFLAILRYRGESPDEVAGMIQALQKNCIPVDLDFPTLDIAGTGGDFANTVNISTGSAILAAACGIPVAKHGNRSVSSRSGSADVLEALGIDIDVPPEQLKQCIREVGIAFMFAPSYHPSLKKISSIRRGLKFPTIFNLLGPLLNPAKAKYALIGVAKESMLEQMSRVVLQLGHTKRTLVFHGCGLDELTPLGKMIAYDIQNGQMNRLEIDPSSLGFNPCSLKELQGGDAQHNAAILKEVFSGQQGAIADSLIFNAGAAVWIFGLASTIEEGIQKARQVHLEKGALKVLEKWKAVAKLERQT